MWALVLQREKARHLVEETQLFIQAAYAYYGRMSEQQAKARAGTKTVPEAQGTSDGTSGRRKPVALARLLGRVA